MPAPSRPVASHPLRSVVVVGAGLAGAQTVAALRAQGFDGHVTVLGAEARAPYDRPPLSKHLFDRTEPAWLTDELGVDVAGLADDVRWGTPALGLEVEPTGVRLATAGGVVRADAVVLASGSAAVLPRGWEGALTLHTAADADVLRARLAPGARLVVVGAGWIGAEVAGVAAAHGVEVTVVEGAPVPLEQALGAAVGALTMPWYGGAGVRLRAGTRVARVWATGVELADGAKIDADVVLAAVGARPATAWADAALPREPDGSFRVDDGYRVIGAPTHVRAVGDVAQRWSRRHGAWMSGGHWDGALRGPATAVRALLADADAGIDAASVDPATVDPTPYVFSTQLGHDLTLYGLPGPGDVVVLRGDPAGAAGWTALWFSPAAGPTAELTAVLAVDRPRDASAARRLLARPTLPRLDPALAADPDRPLREAERD